MFYVNRNKEIDFWKELANGGSKKAIIKYVSFFTDAIGYKDSISLQSFIKYSKMNDIEKMVHYGKQFMDELNEKEAQERKTKKIKPLYYYRQAALSNDTESIFEYGIALIHYNEENFFENDNYLDYHYSSKYPFVPAVFLYATMIMNEIGASLDYKRATRFLKKLVTNKYEPAKILWESILNEDNKSSFGKKIDQNDIFLPQMLKSYCISKTLIVDTKYIDNAVKQFNIGASRHHHKSMFMYATMLLHGIAIKQNVTEALNIFKEAADENFLPACAQYARILMHGIYVAVDKKLAAKYYKKAADLGHLQSMFSYATMLLNGEGIQKDVTKAIEYYKSAADQGHVQSMFTYATMHFYGIGMNVNKKVAANYFKKAADEEHFQSTKMYCEMLLNGIGVMINRKEAVKYLIKLVNVDDVDALVKYASLLQNGDIIKCDKTKAVKYYEKAAEKGSHQAMFNLALIYSNGDGVLFDRNKAIDYLFKAIDHGNPEAREILNEANLIAGS